MIIEAITLDALSKEATLLDTYRVEIHSLESSWYVVRLHHDRGIKALVDEHGRVCRFTGTQWVSRALRPLGFTQAVLTHSDVHDEMIGADTRVISAEERLAFGTRVALQT